MFSGEDEQRVEHACAVGLDAGNVIILSVVSLFVYVDDLVFLIVLIELILR